MGCPLVLLDICARPLDVRCRNPTDGLQRPDATLGERVLLLFPQKLLLG